MRASIESEKTAWPTHSRLGNPYPRGLEPMIFRGGPPGDNDVERVAKREPPDPGHLVTDEYCYVEPEPKCPRLKVRMARQRPDQTDEQYASDRREVEEETAYYGLFLRFCQVLCTHLGNHHTCPMGLCHRNGCCSAIRDQDRYSLSLLIYPPCVPLDREITETYRMEIIAEAKRLVARGDENRPKAEPAAAGRRQTGALAEGQPPEPGGGTARER